MLPFAGNRLIWGGAVSGGGHNDVALFKLNYMRRSASVQGISTKDTARIDPKISNHRADPVPARMAARRYSSRQLPPHTQTQQMSEMLILRTQNATLRAENQRLRQELASLSTRPPAPTVLTEEKKPSYREIIKNKFTSRAKASRITTECETALMSSKEPSLDSSRNTPTVNELYHNYLNSKMPLLEDLTALAQRFFQEYSDNYAKIKVLMSTLKTNQNRPQYTELKEMMELYKVPLLYQKSPQMLFKELSKSKQRPKMKKQAVKEKEEWCMEVLSPQETVAKFEAFLHKLCRSGQMLRMLKNSQIVNKFIAKIQNGKH